MFALYSVLYNGKVGGRLQRLCPKFYWLKIYTDFNCHFLNVSENRNEAYHNRLSLSLCIQWAVKCKPWPIYGSVYSAALLQMILHPFGRHNLFGYSETELNATGDSKFLGFSELWNESQGPIMHHCVQLSFPRCYSSKTKAKRRIFWLWIPPQTWRGACCTQPHIRLSQNRQPFAYVNKCFKTFTENFFNELGCSRAPSISQEEWFSGSLVCFPGQPNPSK